jgi:hypothetical protein
VAGITPESYKPDEILELVEMKQRNQLEITKCDKRDGAYNIDCPSCRRATAVASEIFKEEEEMEKAGIIPTDKTLRPVGWLLIFLGAVIAPPVIFVGGWVLSGGSLGPVVFAVTFLGLGGAIALGVFLYALVVVFCFWYLARQLRIWLVPCTNCGLHICIMISSGNAYVLRKKPV